MSYTAPQVAAGTLTGGNAQTFTAVAPANQELLVENTDLANNITVAINGASGAWTLYPGGKMGYAPKGGIDKVVLTPATSVNTTFQIFIG